MKEFIFIFNMHTKKIVIFFFAIFLTCTFSLMASAEDESANIYTQTAKPIDPNAGTASCITDGSCYTESTAVDRYANTTDSAKDRLCSYGFCTDEAGRTNNSKGAK